MKDPGKEHQEEIVKWLKKMKFRKKIFGGVDEADVWKKIEQLDEKYQAALHDQKLYYEGWIASFHKDDSKGGE